MKKHNLTMVFGILFGLALVPIAYLSLVLGITLAFSGEEFFAYLPYVFAVLAVMSIIASCFARKNIWVSRVVLLLSTLVLISAIIYLLTKEVLTEGVVLFVVYIVVALLGIIATTFAYLAKPKNRKIEN